MILANKRFSDVLNDGFKLFIKTYGTLILPLALFQVILIIIDIFLLTDFRLYLDNLGVIYTAIMNKLIAGGTLTANEWNVLSTYLILSFLLLFLQNLVGAIIITIAMCSVSIYVFKRYMKEDVSLLQSIKSAFNRKILIVILIIGICLPLSSLLLFIPAIFVFGFFIFLVFTYIIEVRKNPILEARSIAKGAFWKIIGIFAFNVILISIIRYFYVLLINIILNTDSAIFIANFNSWYNLTTRNYGMVILYQILMNFVDILMAPLFICLLAVLFSSLKAKKDLKYLYQQGYYSDKEILQIKRKSYEVTENHDSTPKFKQGGRFYCPFCGSLIRSGSNEFCPKCGENLSFMGN